MTRLFIVDGSVVCELNKLFYSKSALMQAINDYKELANITLNEDNKNYIVTIIPHRKLKEQFEGRLSTIGLEFMNYVLSFM